MSAHNFHRYTRKTFHEGFVGSISLTVRYIRATFLILVFWQSVCLAVCHFFSAEEFYWFMNFSPTEISRQLLYTASWKFNHWLRWSTESVATLPPFSPIEGQKWFDQISSQWESQKNRFALIYFGNIQFLPSCIWNLPFMSAASGRLLAFYTGSPMRNLVWSGHRHHICSSWHVDEPKKKGARSTTKIH